MNYYDKIQSMSIEELAEFIATNYIQQLEDIDIRYWTNACEFRDGSKNCCSFDECREMDETKIVLAALKREFVDENAE